MANAQAGFVKPTYGRFEDADANLAGLITKANAYSKGGAGGLQPGQSKSTNTAKSDSTSTSSGGTYFSDPGRVNNLSDVLSNVAGGAGSYYNQYLQDPASSPLFQNQLGTLLKSLRPSEDAARTALSDEFRKAGASNSGAFAQASRMNENDILGNREKTAVNLLGQSFGPTLQALLGGIGQANPLINNLTLNQQQSQSNATSNTTGESGSQAYEPQQGGGGGFQQTTGYGAPQGGGLNYGGSPSYAAPVAAAAPASPGTRAKITEDLSSGPGGLGWGNTPDYYSPSAATGNYGYGSDAASFDPGEWY